MKKRVLAAVLRSATGWYVEAVAAWMLNLGPVVPVLVAASAGPADVGDACRMI